MFRKLKKEVKDICINPAMKGNVDLRLETKWDGVFYVRGELSGWISETPC